MRSRSSKRSAKPSRSMPAGYDVVVARQVLHHARDLGQFCREMARLARPGGLVVTLRDHVISGPEQMQAFLDGHPLHHLYGGENAFTLDAYRSASVRRRPGRSSALWARSIPSSTTRRSPRPTSARPPLLSLPAFVRPLGAAAIALTPFSLLRKLASAVDRRPGRLVSFVATQAWGIGIVRTVWITGAAGFIGTMLSALLVREGDRCFGLDVRACRKDRRSRPRSFVTGPVSEASLAEPARRCPVRPMPFSIWPADRRWDRHFPTRPPTSPRRQARPRRCSTSCAGARRRRSSCSPSSAAVYGSDHDGAIAETASPHPVLALRRPQADHGSAGRFLRPFLRPRYPRRAPVLGLWQRPAQAIALGSLRETGGGDGVVTLGGTGQELRDFIHGADVARALRTLSLPDVLMSPAIVNIGSGQPSSVKLIAETVAASWRERTGSAAVRRIQRRQQARRPGEPACRDRPDADDRLCARDFARGRRARLCRLVSRGQRLEAMSPACPKDDHRGLHADRPRQLVGRRDISAQHARRDRIRASRPGPGQTVPQPGSGRKARARASIVFSPRRRSSTRASPASAVAAMRWARSSRAAIGRPRR